ncbi:RNA-processing protein [Candidatus Micrarchaeota archaeon]|nr:RNA-processing protein [Candidatus Micrarchaeota archaeon]
MNEKETEIVKIPEERVGVLIGKEGSARQLLEKKCNVELSIDSEGEVRITGNPTSVFFCLDVVKAIGRGFKPKTALLLLKDDYLLYIIHLKEIVDSDRAKTRVKGRVIGEKGKIKEQIESSTESCISVYGNTISLIAKMDAMERVKEAVNMLLNGAKHTTVLNFLAKTKRELMTERLRNSQ